MLKIIAIKYIAERGNILFRTAYMSFEFAPSPSGTSIVEKFKRVDDTQGRHLVKVGEEDLYEKIQSFKDSVDLHRILEKCALTGDYTALQRTQGIYGDFSDVPNFRGLCDNMIKARALYDGLDYDIKKDFSTFNDFLSNFADIDSYKSFVEKYSTKNEISSTEITEEGVQE